jgi:hypothetical protein
MKGSEDAEYEAFWAFRRERLHDRLMGGIKFYFAFATMTLACAALFTWLSLLLGTPLEHNYMPVLACLTILSIGQLMQYRLYDAYKRLK